MRVFTQEASRLKQMNDFLYPENKTSALIFLIVKVFLMELVPPSLTRVVPLLQSRIVLLKGV
jgi:hypothetical protein